MTTAHPVRTSDGYRSQSPSSPGLPVSIDGQADPDEMSPLLGTSRAHAFQSSQSERPRWHSAAQSSVSAFLDKNSGLALIATSQFFFSAMNICVKRLNSLNEPVPILEVRVGSEMVVFCADGPWRRAVALGQNGRSLHVLMCV